MTDTMDTETADLIRRWIETFCEIPILIDADLMRTVLNNTDHQGKSR